MIKPLWQNLLAVPCSSRHTMAFSSVGAGQGPVNVYNWSDYLLRTHSQFRKRKRHQGEPTMCSTAMKCWKPNCCTRQLRDSHRGAVQPVSRQSQIRPVPSTAGSQ